MHFNLVRLIVVILGSAVAMLCVASRAEEPKAVLVDEPIIIPSDVPLDLSHLLRSIEEILDLGDIPRLNSSKLVKDATRATEPVQLVGADEPIVIDPAESKPVAEPEKQAPSSQPSNPLRGSTPKTDNADAATSTNKSNLPSSTSSQDTNPSGLSLPSNVEELEPFRRKDTIEKSVTGKSLIQEEASQEPPRMPSEDDSFEPGIQIGERKNSPVPSKSSTTSDSSSSPSRPKPRMVQIKPISPDEQESPQLTNSPREIDAKQARDEDEKAIVAKRPEAATKTFVARPSTGKLSSQGVPLPQIADSASSARSMRVTSCLSYYLANPESVVERSPWAVMHAMLPFGVEGEIMVGNRRVNSIQWMCYNGTCRTQKLFTPAGKYFRPNVGGGVQGHEGQFLAMLAQSQVAANYPIVVGQNKFTVTDLIRYEMATCKAREELTFKLIGLSYYIDTEQVWLTDKRNRWNIGRLVQEELAQPINGAACGGTHRLMGLTFAVRQRTAEGRPIDGQFARADRYVKDFVEYAWKLQNPDGSFSTNWFESRGNDSNMERKVQTTGHILEWLAFTVPDEELTSARFTKSIDFLLSQIWDQRQNKWPIGPRGHATRAIALYHQRTTGLSPGQRQSQLAEQIQNLRMAR